MTRKLTDAELDFLTPEERAVLGADYDETALSADDTNGLEPVDTAQASGFARLEDASAPAGGTPADAGMGAAAPAASGPAPTPQARSPQEPATPDFSPFDVPLVRADAPADAHAQLEMIRARKMELLQEFDEGQMPGRKFAATLEMLDDIAVDLKLSLLKDRLAREFQDQQREQTWRADVAAFVAEHPEVHGNEVLWHAFDLVVRRVTAAEADSGVSNRDLLAKAYQLWGEQLGYTPPRAPDPVLRMERRIPPTLAKVPAARMPDTGENRWSALDRLAATDPDAYEERLARMSAADLKDYERLN